MLCRGLRDAQDVLHGMLAVRIRRHHAQRVRTGEEDLVEARFERPLLAHVDGVDRHSGAHPAALLKQRSVLFPAAVVHQHDSQLFIQQTAGQIHHPGIRLIGRDQDDDPAKVLFFHATVSSALHTSLGYAAKYTFTG